MTAAIDHLVYACPDLDATVAEMTRLTGIRPQGGGQHPGLGTHNALLSLGDRTYLEIIAPDPAQPGNGEPLPFGLDHLAVPALRAWAAAPSDLDAAVREARANGFDYGDIVTRRRRAPDNSELSWRMTTYPRDDAVAVLPFLIDWGQQRHPAQTAPPGLRLSELRILAPNARQVLRQLRATSIDLPVDQADAPALRAVLTGPGDTRVVLAS
jgi:catechol 2,3-dioxygenase-like lactoylglutathione lyase family enzyme